MVRFHDGPDRGATRGKKHIRRRPSVHKRLRRRSSARCQRRARPAYRRNGDHRKDGTPIAPVRDLNQIVAPHQPYEVNGREPMQKRFQRIGRVMRSEVVLDVCDNDARMLSNIARGGEALLHARHVFL